MTQNDLNISRLGPCLIKSPLHRFLESDDYAMSFVHDSDQVLFDPTSKAMEIWRKQGEVLPGRPPGTAAPSARPALSQAVPMLELAGPRSEIYFKPEEVRAAIVTCGGLCPGINDVIRSLTMELYYRYGVQDIRGIRYGYRGFIERFGYQPMMLTPEAVHDIHRLGGSILSSSRGEQSSEEIAQFLKKHKINCLFTVGGDGTMRAAREIAEYSERAGLKVSVVGIPKTVDNDILFIDHSFGFETAFSEAEKSIFSAHTEAHGAPNGIGLVKLMGRQSGFIACYAALATTDVNFVLIPEVPFRLNGDGGFLATLKERLERRGHAVIVVAEGTGQELMEGEPSGTDASGNPRLKDIGVFLKHKINAYFKELDVIVNLKYIDPSYMIRSVPASAPDSVYCFELARHAVHAAMSGRTKMVVGRRHGFYVHLPMALIGSGRKRVDPDGELWFAVLEATGQPVSFHARRPMNTGAKPRARA